MQLTFTPAAARKVRSIIQEKGGNLAVRIHIRSKLGKVQWSMGLEPNCSEAMMVDGVPVVADQQSQSYLDGIIIDWIQTPQGPGFGIFSRDLQKSDLRLGAD